jgi:hypothetical protein
MRILFVPCVVTSILKGNHNLKDTDLVYYLMTPSSERSKYAGICVTDGTIYIKSGMSFKETVLTIIHELLHHFIFKFFGENSSLHEWVEILC